MTRASKFLMTIAVRALLLTLVLAVGALLGLLCARELVRKQQAAIGQIVSPQGIDVGEYVRLGGVNQWITIRGQDRRAPILLYLHGGPGGATSDLAFTFQRPWEDFFTVVQWDQRGSGRSVVDRAALGGAMSKDQLVADAIALIEHLTRRLAQPKIILVGHSWGSILGAEVARRRPDLLHAYIGLGQVTGWEGNFIESRRALSQLAASTGDRVLAAEIAEMREPPPADDARSFLAWVSTLQRPIAAHGGLWHNANSSADVGGRMLMSALSSPTLSLGDLWRMLRSDREAVLYPLAQSAAGWSFRNNLGTQFATPMIFISGRHDLQAPTAATAALASEMCSPYTAMLVLDHSAHVLLLEEPGRLLNTLVSEALPFAEGRWPGGQGRSCATAPMSQPRARMRDGE